MDCFGTSFFVLYSVSPLPIGKQTVLTIELIFSFGDLLCQVRTGAAQVEGGIHGLVSYEKKSF